MADSNITKRALASALKELINEKPFGKISVSDICEKCDMNRKSFYYHFKDKYDLVNWIFDTEFIAIVNKKINYTGWDFLNELCNYLYINKDFYRKALKIEGQNSFKEHFRELLQSVIAEQLKGILNNTEIQDFHINFFTDGFVSAIGRWIADKECANPREFLSLLKSCINQTAIKVYNEIDAEKQKE